MASKKTLNRDEIDKKYKWNIEDMYRDEAKVDEDLDRALKMAEEFAGFKGHLGDDAETLLKAFREGDEIWRLIENAYTYAHMKKDEDNRVSKYQAMTDKCMSYVAKASAACAFMNPELMTIDEELLYSFLDECPELEQYRFVIERALRKKPHVLSQAEETLMATLSEAMGSSGEIFDMLNDADLKFGEIDDEDGDKVEVTHGRYISLMESQDRRVRKEAFEHMYAQFKSHINTIATTYSYNVKEDCVVAKLRHYPSALEAALSSDNVDKEVYTNLIDVVHEALPTLHKYLGIRKKMLGVDELHMYDVYVPLVKLDDEEITFEQACDIMRAALVPMGDDYLYKMNKGLKEGWVDVYENVGKTSGAYSFGSYDSMPYILMNFQGKLKDTFTLIHEMGHSMHSRYTRAYQPFTYGSHSIFTAEVASTVNENLLIKYLLKQQESTIAECSKLLRDRPCDDCHLECNPKFGLGPNCNATKEDRETKKRLDAALHMEKYLLNLYIEEFRTTLFRQTMFAEFEMICHDHVEAGGTLTADWCCEQYLELNKLYFGPDVVMDDEIKYEWSRIPHFYRSFYVYKYATGFSAASALSDLILNEGGKDDYIEFLKLGCSKDPIDLLKIAGVDMSKPEPIRRAMDVFKDIVKLFETLVEE